MSFKTPKFTSRHLNLKETIDILCTLNQNNPVDFIGDLEELCERNIKAAEIADQQVSIPEEVLNLAPSLNFNFEDDRSKQWRYLRYNIYYLLHLADIFKDNKACLSVQETNQLKNVLRNVIGVGIASNLLPRLPYYIPLPSKNNEKGASVLIQYKKLLTTTAAMIVIIRIQQLKALVLSNLKWILSGLYQIVYCPLKKPSLTADANGFTMTEEIYTALINDRQIMKERLHQLSTSTSSLLYIRETMMVVGTFTENKVINAPPWLQKAVFQHLTGIMQRPKGIENITLALLDAAGLDESDDSTKSWKCIDIVAKMVLNCKTSPDFQENICDQLRNLLSTKTRSELSAKPFERLVSLCTKMLFQQDEVLCQEVLIKHLLTPLSRLTKEEECYLDNENITDLISQTVRLLHSLIVEENFSIPPLPVNAVASNANLLYHIYAVANNIKLLKETTNDVKEVFLKIMRNLDDDIQKCAFDTFLFGFENEHFLNLKSGAELYTENNLLSVKYTQHAAGLRPLLRCDVLKDVIKTDTYVSVKLFTYLLNCVSNPKKYFTAEPTKQDLLQLEGAFVLDDILERKLAVHNLLAEFSDRVDIQKYINEHPSEVVTCMKVLLGDSINNKSHLITNCDSDEFQTLFVVVSLLNALISGAPENVKSKYNRLEDPLRILSAESASKELQIVAKETLDKISQEAEYDRNLNDSKSELDEALNDVCDALVPVRGHGLMILTKLIEKKDSKAMEMRNRILNIFQLNIKSEESYLYLNAIAGLAAMGDLFPDIILNLLAEEFSAFNRNSDDANEARMKVGEVLVRVTKRLGDTAPKYKALLLNTFLVGTKDDDHLIRASSLSNLGEICRVLGYKLGSIVTEVLVCIHAIIATDKAVEARRAAVTVIRQLFVGLEQDTIAFLKEEILPIYRTLKHIYYDDPDDVMRLQAQLALEELNENIKDFIFPKPQLHIEKKLVILD